VRENAGALAPAAALDTPLEERDLAVGPVSGGNTLGPLRDDVSA
jgi:hypothetical protein